MFTQEIEKYAGNISDVTATNVSFASFKEILKQYKVTLYGAGTNGKELK